MSTTAIPEATLTDAQRAVLQAACHFLHRCGRDYYSVRLLSHFLLHAGTGLKVAQARDKGIDVREARLPVVRGYLL